MDRLSEETVRDIVKARIAVNRQRVAIMKGLLLKHFRPTTRHMIDAAIDELGYVRPQQITLRRGDDGRVVLERLGDYFSWMFAGIEAVWGLVHAGILLPDASGRLTTVSTSVLINHDYNGSRSAGGEDFDSFGGVPAFPESVNKTRCASDGFILSDPDLYVISLQAQVVHVEVADALEEAVRCFRSELFMASAVMLGKASEGVWIEVGKALIDALPKVDQSKYLRLRTDLDSANVGFAKKLRDITKHYESKQVEYDAVAKDAGLFLDDIRLASLWSDSVRDSRNIVHYGTQPNLPNNYQNMATLLLTGATHLRNLYSLYRSAIAHPGM